MFSVCCFGAKIKRTNEINICFPINFIIENPDIYTIDNIIDCYYKFSILKFNYMVLLT